MNSADNFCYVGGETKFLSQKSAIILVSVKLTIFILTARIGDQDKGWSSHICCNTCVANCRSLVAKGYQFLVPYPWCEEWIEGNIVACNNDHVLVTDPNINHNRGNGECS